MYIYSPYLSLKAYKYLFFLFVLFLYVVLLHCMEVEPRRLVSTYWTVHCRDDNKVYFEFENPRWRFYKILNILKLF